MKRMRKRRIGRNELEGRNKVEFGNSIQRPQVPRILKPTFEQSTSLVFARYPATEATWVGSTGIVILFRPPPVNSAQQPRFSRRPSGGSPFLLLPSHSTHEEKNKRRQKKEHIPLAPPLLLWALRSPIDIALLLLCRPLSAGYVSPLVPTHEVWVGRQHLNNQLFPHYRPRRLSIMFYLVWVGHVVVDGCSTNHSFPHFRPRSRFLGD